MSISVSRAVTMMIGTLPARPQLAADLGAGQPGHHQVEQHDVGALPVVRGQPGRAVGGLGDLEALLCQQEAEGLAVGVLVLDDQDPGHAGGSFLAARAASG